MGNNPFTDFLHIGGTTPRGGWDSESWRRRYEKAREREVHRTLRVEVYQHTIDCVKAGFYVTEEREKRLLPDPTPMVRDTFFAVEPFTVEKKARYEEEIQVWNQDTLSSAKQLVDAGLLPAVLNMANRHTPGGGVRSGAGAQEENIFRRSNLFLSLYQFGSHAAEYGLEPSPNRYPMDRNFGGIYSPGVTVFRGEEKDGYPLLSEPYTVDVISVAGINGPRLDAAGRMSTADQEITRNKIRTILRLALRGGNDTLVLGALGCGAFRNPPEQIAALFHSVLQEDEFEGGFRHVVFAIRHRHATDRYGRPAVNYEVFRREFEESR